MLVIFISCLGLSLEAILVAGGLRTKLAQRFPLFYSYVLFVFVQDVLRSIVYRWYSDLYPNVYWVSQFVALVLGSIVVFEICRVGLREFPGTARMARNLLGVAFLGIFGRWLLELVPNSPAWPSVAYVDLERDLRAVQSVGLVILYIVAGVVCNTAWAKPRRDLVGIRHVCGDERGAALHRGALRGEGRSLLGDRAARYLRIRAEHLDCGVVVRRSDNGKCEKR